MNIVHIFCDELRQDALECYGNPAGTMHTPNIDFLAKNGSLFENCFCNSPVCVPSRVSILTGLYPEDTNVYHNEAALASYELRHPLMTFPEVLCKNGYHTANFGKTHLPQQMHPFEWDDPTGSDMRLGLTQEEINDMDLLSPAGKRVLAIAGLYPEKTYMPEELTTKALEWMGKQTNPYYVRISYLQPHTPVILKRGYEKIYEGYPFSGKLEDISELSKFEQAFAGVLGGKDLSEEERIRAKVYYYGMVCWVDDQVGRIIDFLQKDMENTIIIFNADHGALRGECQCLSKQIFNRACQAVPLIICDPRRPGGERISKLCSNIDIARTIFGLLGIETPESFKGVDLLKEEEETVYATIGFGEPDSYALSMMKMGRAENGEGWPRRGCIREGCYRLDMTIKQNGRFVDENQEDVFFVDTSVCPEENRNMFGQVRYQDIITQLRDKLRNHCRKIS